MGNWYHPSSQPTFFFLSFFLSFILLPYPLSLVVTSQLCWIRFDTTARYIVRIFGEIVLVRLRRRRQRIILSDHLRSGRICQRTNKRFRSTRLSSPVIQTCWQMSASVSFQTSFPIVIKKKKKINRRPNFFTFFPNFRNVSVVCRTSLGEWSGIHRRGNQQSYAKCRKHYIAWYPQDIFGWCIGACIH